MRPAPYIASLRTSQAAPDCVVAAVSSPQREDSDKIGALQYFPPNGTFNLMYYPYYGKKAQVSEGLDENSQS